MANLGRRLFLVLTKLAINALGLVVVDVLFQGIWLETTQATIATAVLLALVNTWLRPILVVLTLPLTILTLGLFTLVINAVLLLLIAWLVPAFHVSSFWTALGAALVISLISLFLNSILKPNGGRRAQSWR